MRLRRRKTLIGGPLKPAQSLVSVLHDVIATLLHVAHQLLGISKNVSRKWLQYPVGGLKIPCEIGYCGFSITDPRCRT